MTKKHKTTLGRGLNALLGADGTEHFDALTSSTDEAQTPSIAMLPLSQIQPNPHQPRQHFDAEALSELAESIRALGLVQPITVQRVEGGYQIISGERRYRAAQEAGLSELPAYVRTLADVDIMELALVENIQREDLNAIEIALAYQTLIEQTGATQDSVAKRVGKKRATVSNYLRLLRLPSEVQMGLSQRKLEMGHARALLGVEDPERLLELYHMTLNEGLSVREVEELARAIQQGGEEEEQQPKVEPAKKPSPSEGFRELEQHLGRVFGSNVRFRCSKQGKGSISIPFSSEEDLDRLIALLQRIQQD